MKSKVLIGAATAAILGGASIWSIAQMGQSTEDRDISKSQGIVQYASNSSNLQNNSRYGAMDFTMASEQAVKSVVHITTKSEVAYQSWYGVQNVPQTGSGSGVVISEDGYIVTNNHVVQGAKEVNVTFNNYETKKAKVIGTDPASDLAVIKVEGNNYPFVIFGNSDEVKLGQWVLAVGYPLNLDVTVTAGIVSAKSRNIGINQKNSRKYAIESFIQTDAAVNMGNSGGALVNTDGLLVGINSAIATPTGAYAGYSYAIPSNLARKVVNDLIEYGSVQRGFMGASLLDLSRINPKAANELGLNESILNGNHQGVVVADVIQDGGAAIGGLKQGDLITSIDNKKTINSSELMEQVAMYNPGDKVKVDYLRNGRNYSTEVLLKSQDELNGKSVAKNSATEKKKLAASTDSYSQSDFYSDKFGFGFKNISEKEKDQGISNGVVVTEIEPGGKLNSFMRSIQEGFVITKINGKKIESAEQAMEVLENGKGLSISGTYPGTGSSYSFSYR